MSDERAHIPKTVDAEALAFLTPRPASADGVNTAWDRALRWLKPGLPVAALLLVLLIASWPLLRSTEVSFTLSRSDIMESGDKIRFEKPVFAGIDNKGRPYRVSAQSGVQDTPDSPRILFTGIEASLQLNETDSARLTADSAAFRVKDDLLELGGDAVLTTSDGKYFRLRGARADLKSHMVTSTAGDKDTAVSGKGPFGSFSAHRFTIDVDARTAVFEGGVKMSIRPNRIKRKD